MRPVSGKQGEVFWPKFVLKKLLNISGKDTDFNADERDYESELDEEDEISKCERDEGTEIIDNGPYKPRRRNSETFRAQYITTKELRICIGTWNVGGKIPPDNLDITNWLDTEEPADIYVIGFQEVVPLNAGNVFGAEDNRPILKWEEIIRENLNRIQLIKPKYKCFSDPPSPSRFNPSEDAISAIDELLPDESDSDSDFESMSPKREIFRNKRLDRLDHFIMENENQSDLKEQNIQAKKLNRTLSRSERIGLVWPERPLDLFPSTNKVSNLSGSKSFKSVKSFRNYSLFKISDEGFKGLREELETDLGTDGLGFKKKSSPFVRIISKQMVGIFVSIWVRRNLRKHIQNLKVSAVGVGAMGYIGNKGSISVSMSIYQTLFCFVCSHLSSGERETDLIHRNSDVQEIHRRTQFSLDSDDGLPKFIYDHERIFWLGDLNYRLDCSYEKTHELISDRDWSQLAEKDQLKRELKKGRAFDGWTEGLLNFAPTYKYSINSDKYIPDDHKGGKRSPAWCDRILTFGKGVKLLKYKRSEQKLSDHRPVSAAFNAEVEVFCHRKLQKALTLTNAEIEDGDLIPDLDLDFSSRVGRFRIGADTFKWDR